MSQVSPGTIYLFCGKMASGKSTLAKQMSVQKSIVLISEDELLGTLYPGLILDVSSYVQYSEKLKSAITPILISLLSSGTSVVLDFPANTVSQRKWFKEIIEQAKARYELHYLKCSDAICKAQLLQRVAKEPERQATDTLEMFDAITRYFEPPTSEEGFEIQNHDRISIDYTKGI